MLEDKDEKQQEEPKPVVRANTNTFVDNKGLGSVKDEKLEVKVIISDNTETEKK